MAYNDTPQAAQRINATQPLIQTNFANVQADFSVNHSPINNATPAVDGMHIKVDTIRIAAEPTAAGNDLTLYNFLNATTARSEMYVRRNGAAGIPFTARGAINPGWSYLPSGLLLKWGQNVTNVANFNLNGFGPNFSNAQIPFLALATPILVTHGVAAAQITGTAANPRLNLATTVAGVTVSWLVMGI